MTRIDTSEPNRNAMPPTPEMDEEHRRWEEARQHEMEQRERTRRERTSAYNRHRRRQRPPTKRALEMASTGASMQAVGGIAAVVLGIIGLAGSTPIIVAGVAAIVLGVGLMLGAIAMLAEHAEITSETETTASYILAYCGLGLDIFGGLGAIALGALALSSVAVGTVVAVAVILLGAVLVLSSATTSALLGGTRTPGTGAGSGAAAGAQIMIGLGAVTLGALGLEATPLVLSLIGFLILGAALLVLGTAVSGRAFGLIRIECYTPVHSSHE